MRYTANYNLKKPEGTDIVNIDDLNENADIIDQKLKELENGVYNAPPNSVSDSAIGTRTPDQTQAPTSPGSGTLSQILSWLANRIKTITGKTNWWDAPPTTLQAAKNHIDAAAPHSGHETPSGAQAKVDTHASSKQTHGISSGYYIAKTSRSDQLPAWGDIQGKPDLASAAEVQAHVSDNVKHITSSERTAWNNKLDASAYTAADVLAKVKTVDGSESGLDADLLDGAHAGNGPNNVLKLDSGGFVPLPNIPGTLTGKSADMVDGKHFSDIQNDAQTRVNNHASSKQTHGISSGYYIAKTSRSDQLPAWGDIQGKPNSFTPATHGNEAHNPAFALASDLTAHLDDNVKHITNAERNAWNAKETPSGAQSKVDAHASSKQTHGISSGYYIAKTSRSDQLPAWGDIQGKPDLALAAELDAHKAETATQDALGHIRLQDIPVKSVNGKTGEVVIDVGDIPGLVSNDLALGRNASAVGSGSVAVGPFSAGRGDVCVALGFGASAQGNYSAALGLGSAAQNNYEGVLGGTGTASTRTWKVPGSFTVSGTKNFEIPHPKPEKSATHVIRHGAVESPTPGDTLYRWRVQASKDNDLVTIDLPDYFIYLNKDVQIWVTGQGHFGNGYGELNRETEQLEIHCQYAGEYNVLVIGTRNDDHPSVQEWYIKGVEREIGESWTGETYAFSVEEILEVEEIKEVSA